MTNQNIYGCLTDFSIRKLNGHKAKRLYVGDSPDLRTCEILYTVNVIANWPSQWHSRFPEGFMKLRTQKGVELFDRKNQTIRGQRRYLFVFNPEGELIYQRLSLLTTLEVWSSTTRVCDLIAMLELSGSNRYSRPFFEKEDCRAWIRTELSARFRTTALSDGVSALQRLVDVVNVRSGDQAPDLRMRAA